MLKIVCSKCKEVFFNCDKQKCPRCGVASPFLYHFNKSDEFLREKATLIRDDRKSVGLEGLVGGLDCIIINTEPDRQKAAVQELLSYTGFCFEGFQEADEKRICLLKRRDSANV